MIVIERIENRFKTYSDEDYMIKPIYDRLGKPINPNALYEVAEDIEVDGHPRYDYEETDTPIEHLPEEEEEEEVEP